MNNKFDNALYGLTTLIECGSKQFKSQGSGFYYNVMSPKILRLKEDNGEL